MMQLNLGCGKAIDAAFHNVDREFHPGVDQVWNLDTRWPWRDGSVAFIRAYDIFEHIDNPLLFMQECYRVLEDGGVLHLRTNYWKCENAFTDPTHKRFCTEHTFDYWIVGTELYEGDAAYARAVHFERVQYWMDGQEQCFLLRKLPSVS